MRVPPEVSVKGFVMTHDIDTLLTNKIAGLEKVCNYITGIRVAIEKDQGRHQMGNPYRIRLDIRVPPNHEIVVSRQTVLHNDTRMPAEPETDLAMIYKRQSRLRKDEPLPTAIRYTFDSARRRLKKLVELQRKQIKTHPQNQVMGFIEKIFRDGDYGFIRSLQGQQVYFHKNSIIHIDWDRLEVGTGIRYVEENGDKGLQASSLEIVDRPGAGELHEEMHELPVIVTNKKISRRRVRAGITAT